MPMRKGTLLIFGFLFGAAAAAWSGPVATQRVSLGEAASVDLGTMWAGETAEIVFTLVNETEADYAIRSITSTCHCTVPDRDIDLIPAGGEIDLRVEFEAPVNSGSSRRAEIRIIPASEGLSSWPLMLSARIQQALSVDPPVVNFGRLPSDQSDRPVIRSLRIHNHLDEGVRITDIEATPEIFTASITSVEIEAGESVDLQITARGNSRSGTHPGHLTGRVSVSMAPQLTVPLVLEVQSRISAEPANIWLGFLEPDQIVSRPVVISAQGIPGFAVTGVDLHEPGLTAEIVASAEGTATISVSADASQREPGLINTELAVHTSDSAEPLVRIDVLGTVRPNPSQ